MADASSDRPLRWRNNWKETGVYEKWVLDNSAAQTVYASSPMLIDASADTVYARIFNADVTLASNDTAIGIAMEGKVVATADTETDNEINIWTWGEVGLKLTHSLTDANLGETIYADDSGTLTTTSTGNLALGKLMRVEDGFAYVFVNMGGQSITA